MADEKTKGQGEKLTPRIETPVVPRVYLKPPDINKFSMWHRAYVGGLDGSPMRVLEILGGTKKGLSQADFDLFSEAGIITTERPRRTHEDDD